MSVRNFLVLACLIAVLGCGGGAAHTLSDAEKKAAEAKMAEQLKMMNSNLPAKLPKGTPTTGTPTTTPDNTPKK